MEAAAAQKVRDPDLNLKNEKLRMKNEPGRVPRSLKVLTCQELSEEIFSSCSGCIHGKVS